MALEPPSEPLRRRRAGASRRRKGAEGRRDPPPARADHGRAGHRSTQARGGADRPPTQRRPPRSGSRRCARPGAPPCPRSAVGSDGCARDRANPALHPGTRLRPSAEGRVECPGMPPTGGARQRLRVGERGAEARDREARAKQGGTAGAPRPCWAWGSFFLALSPCGGWRSRGIWRP